MNGGITIIYYQSPHSQLDVLKIDVPDKYDELTGKLNCVKNYILFDFLNKRIGLHEAERMMNVNLKSEELGTGIYGKTNLLLDWFLCKREEVNQPLPYYKRLFAETEPNFPTEREEEWIM